MKIWLWITLLFIKLFQIEKKNINETTLKILSCAMRESATSIIRIGKTLKLYYVKLSH